LANLFDYLKWRGDIDLCVSPLNEIDALILSEISYLDFSDLIPEDGISLKDLAKKFFSDARRVIKPLGLIIPDSIPVIFKFAARTRRFEKIKVIAFESDTDPSLSKQFSATAFDTSDRCVVVAYRGTDDSIVGWKENFRMSYFKTVPAQLDAKSFLEKVALEYPSAPIRIAGHSKGGNLATFAALSASREIRERIMTIYCFDGPGLLGPIADNENYKALGDRIRTFVPENSVVGLLLSYDEKLITVRSGGKGLYQHDAFNWKVNVNRFETLPENSQSNLKTAKVIKKWLASSDLETRREFCETFFDILQSTGAKTLTDLSADRFVKAREVLSAINRLDKEKKRMMADVLSVLIKESLKSTSKTYLSND